MAGWTYKHPPRGTCVSGCPLYSKCHCGCGKKTRISPHNIAPLNVVWGQPRVFLKHHYNPRANSPGGWQRNGIPFEKVEPLVRWLKDRYEFRQVVEITGLRRGTVNNLLYKSQSPRMVAPATAKGLRDAVLAHRKKRDPLSTFDTEPVRMIPESERETMLAHVAQENQRWQQPPRNVPDEIHEEWERLYKEGWSLSEIGRKYDRKHSTVRSILTKRGVA